MRGERGRRSAKDWITRTWPHPQKYMVQHPTTEMSKAANDVALHNMF